MREKRQAWKFFLARQKIINMFFTIFFVFHLTLYISQFIKWTGEDNANLIAKRYWVVGQVLNSFRQGLTTVIHPEVPILLPANILQEWIFKVGSGYLPEGDGEIAVWKNSWFYNHYSRMGRRPLFVVAHKASPEMEEMLDQWWLCLETMSTKPFADKQMEEEHYYRDFVSLAMSYSLEKGFYGGRKLLSASRVAKSPFHIERARQLEKWLLDLSEKWKDSNSTSRFLKKHPKLETMWHFVVLREIETVIHGEINQKKFECNNNSLKKYINIRSDFVGNGSKKPAYLRMKDKKQAKYLYDWTINNPGPRYIKYILKNYCNYEVFGKENNSYYDSFAKHKKTTSSELAEYTAKSAFYDEIKILEGKFNE